MEIELDDFTDPENYILHVELDGCPEFQICIPKEMDEFIEHDDPPYKYYLNFKTRTHYMG